MLNGVKLFMIGFFCIWCYVIKGVYCLFFVICKMCVNFCDCMDFVVERVGFVGDDWKFVLVFFDWNVICLLFE